MSDCILDHQDWKTIVFQTKQSPSSKKGKKNHTKETTRVQKLEKLADQDQLKHSSYSDELRKKIIDYRRQKKLSQKQLAQILNIPLKTIQDIETNRALYDPKINNLIKRKLKI